MPCHPVLGARFAMQESGYFTAAMFSDVVSHIIDNTDAEHKLLILDGHDSHFEPDALDL